MIYKSPDLIKRNPQCKWNHFPAQRQNQVAEKANILNNWAYFHVPGKIFALRLTSCNNFWPKKEMYACNNSAGKKSLSGKIGRKQIWHRQMNSVRILKCGQRNCFKVLMGNLKGSLNGDLLSHGKQNYKLMATQILCIKCTFLTALWWAEDSSKVKYHYKAYFQSSLLKTNLKSCKQIIEKEKVRILPRPSWPGQENIFLRITQGDSAFIFP